MARPGRLLTWVSLDEEDNDPNRFLAHLGAALQRVNPSWGRTVQAQRDMPAAFGLLQPGS
jgi:ATP/maltotriose-dependent transcriptional regulator MalT